MPSGIAGGLIRFQGDWSAVRTLCVSSVFIFQARIIVVKNEDATHLFFFTLDFSKKCDSFNDRHQCGARRPFDSVQGSSSEILTDYHLVAIRQFAYEIINSHELY